jgi:transposase
MYGVEIYATVWQLVLLQGKSRREVARQLGISRDSVSKMCRYAAPPGYVRTKPVDRPKTGVLPGVIDAILDGDDTAPAKQRHTAKRVWRRLRDEHGFTGGYSTVRDYVRRTKTRRREVSIPLAHPPGHAQIDFGEAVGVIAGQTSRRQRKKVEMLFAHLKRILKFDRLRLRGPNGARDEFHLAATAQNLRKLAKLLTAPMPQPA